MNQPIQKLYCRFVTGLTVEINLKPDTIHVKDLKALLAEYVNLTVDRLFIGFETTMLNDNDNLANAGITDQDTVHVITSQLTEKIAYRKKN